MMQPLFMQNHKCCFLFFLLLSASLVTTLSVQAQQPLNKEGMTYVFSPKPNSIIYHDSLFRGSQQFKHLFFRTGQADLLALYDKHQANKITGQALGFAGVVAILVGVNNISTNAGTGWALVGGGFLLSVSGGYFTLQAQKNLTMAVQLFNQRQKRNTVGIGVGAQSAGLVMAF
ncbi:MAG: hypothetical protein EAZ62_02835 [Sphingobacteriia bacterium]|nr:MAG: hypothetical protein EAZ62_02835 [Sphingobacteriia bacterium]